MSEHVGSPSDAIPSHAPDLAEAISIVNAHGIIRFATPAAAHYYGYSVNDLLGHSVLRFVARESQPYVRARWQTLLDHPDCLSDEIVLAMVSASGQHIPVRASIWRLPNGQGFLLAHQVVDRIRDRLETLYVIQSAVARSLDLDEILDTVLREVHRLIPSGTSTIFILDENGVIHVRRWQEKRMDHYRSLVHEHLPEFETSRIIRETNAPLIINDTATDPRWVPLPNHRPIRSWLGAPLTHHGVFMGELNLDSPIPDQFTQEDAELAHALAIQVAAALYRVRQFQEEQRRTNRFRALSDVSEAISQLELHNVLQVVYQKVSHLMDTSTFFIGLYDAEAGQVRIVGSYDNGIPRPDEVQGADVGITGLVLRTRQPLIIRDSTIDPVPDSIIVQDEMPRSLLMMPLITQDDVVGVISVQGYIPHAYDTDDIAMLETIAGAVATAVRNAQLFDQTAYRLHALETLHALSLDLAAVQDPDEIARLVTQAALPLFGPCIAWLCLCDGLPWQPQSWIGQRGEGGKLLVESRQELIAPGLIARACMQDLPLALPDLNREPDLLAELDLPWRVRAAVLTPVQRGEVRFATLGLLYDEPQVFRKDTLRILDMMSLQAAAAFENARSTIALQRRLTEVTALNDLARRVSAMQSLDDILNTVVQTIREVYQCKSASIALLDEELAEVITLASSGLSPEHAAAARFKYGEYVAGEVVATNRVIYVSDTRTDPRIRVVDPEVISLMVVPLTVQGRGIGTLGIDSATPNAFTHDHERVLTIAGGQIAAAIETVRLLHETRERAEELTGANIELQAQEELRKEMIYQVSHDLRSPLQIVYGYADMMYNAELGPVTDMQKDVLGLVIKRSKAIERLTKDILAVKPINRNMLELEWVDLTRLCQQAMTDIQIVFRDERFTFETGLYPASMMIEADYNRLSRVLDNLLNNAVKFSPNGGRITLRTDCDAARHRALIAVSDCGIGIAADKIAYVFERFYRADRKRFDGSGLGLYIVQQIIHAHGGEVWVDSEEGKGSTFTVALPLVER